MILVDTSVWINHFRSRNPVLVRALTRKAVELHPFVLGEISCGQTVDRKATLAMLAHLRPATVVPHGLVMRLVEHHRMFGSGMGWIDMHLLATALTGGHEVYTNDAALAKAAQRLGVAFSP